jgi:hypothetical protein
MLGDDKTRQARGASLHEGAGCRVWWDLSFNMWGDLSVCIQFEIVMYTTSEGSALPAHL